MDHAMDSTRAALEEHWSASERGNTEAEHAIYADDAILDHPQSGERFRGRATISAQRGGHPADRHFAIRRLAGSGDLWVSECTITYHGVPTHSVSIMELPTNTWSTKRSTSRTPSAHLPGARHSQNRCRAGRSPRRPDRACAATPSRGSGDHL